MATFIWQDLMDRARVYLDDDHDEDSGIIAPDKLLMLANVEYKELRKRWLRNGLVHEAPTDTTFTAGQSSITINGVAAIIGVAQNLGSSTPFRVLTPAQSGYGVSPVWGTVDSNRASSWFVTGPSDNLTVQLDPPDVSNTYFVRYIPTIPYATDPLATVDVPDGCDERLVLGIARRANVKFSSKSALVQQLIDEADALANFAAFGRIMGDSPRVRRVNPTVKSKQWLATGMPFPNDPRMWRYV